ncbi:hypothetical protein NDU88_008747 [Pleurodeles waltl]|uniref:Uncharacterized protein n=1 Tax=Pleurodeles waltl TaxID=8319 RepID=A0AAV7RWD7_PLEWA|nr:hypothetical protein NDU88_008747 [Pleurodeles waltl]
MECPGGTSKCGTSGRRDGVKNPEEDAWVLEPCKPKGDADREVTMHRRGTTGTTASRDEEEAWESRFGQKVKQEDDHDRTPVKDALAHHVPIGTWFHQVCVHIWVFSAFWGTTRETRRTAGAGSRNAIKYNINLSDG